ncbi:MAG: IS982 family transposase [Bacteroidota bacterium]|nr:IS982 family transposase [Bacteroidota bacterium]
MLINALKVVEIFCEIDDFCTVYEEKLAPHLLPSATSAHSVNKPCIALSEMMTIEILYHRSAYKCFQYYYEEEVLGGGLQSYFPSAPSYNRFVELKPRMLTALIGYLHCLRLGALLGLYYGDSTPLAVCHNRRIKQHKVFAGIAKRGKTSVDWFFGFKLFIVVNGLGELVRAFLTTGNVSDGSEATIKRLFKGLRGVAFADKGFINPKAFEALLEGGLKLVTSIRSNMKNKVMILQEKLLLKKRGMVEAVIDILKSICDIEHSRHRSPINMLVNTYAALCAYTTLERKPTIFI